MAATSYVNPKFHSRTFDANLQLADTQTVTTSAALTVSSSAKIIDLGAATRIKASAYFQLGAADATTGDERSTLIIQGSNSSTFASGNYNLAERTFGDSTTNGESADNLGDEEMVMHFENVREVAGVTTVFRYIRGYVLGAGTSPSLIVNLGYICLDG